MAATDSAVCMINGAFQARLCNPESRKSKSKELKVAVVVRQLSVCLSYSSRVPPHNFLPSPRFLDASNVDMLSYVKTPVRIKPPDMEVNLRDNTTEAANVSEACSSPVSVVFDP
jgi:hypothetical protein